MSYALTEAPPVSPVLSRAGDAAERVRRARAEVAKWQAEEAAALAEAAGLIPLRAAERRAEGLSTANDLPAREICAELGTAIRMSDRTVQRHLSHAWSVVAEFPATHHAWGEGRVDQGHVVAIVTEGVVIEDPDLRRAYEAHVLGVAEAETPSRVQKIARTVAARIDPSVSAKRRKKAITARGVRVLDLGDGMSRIQTDVAAPLAHGVDDRVDQIARTVYDTERADAADRGAAAGELRTLAQIRADVLIDLLLTAVPTAHTRADGTPLDGIRGVVHLTIPVATAAGISDDPATMPDHGPVDTDLARRILATTPTWNRVLVDLPTGLPVAVDRYRPSAELRRFIDYRDEHCRFPGCLMKPWRCDADHTIDAAHGGPTTQSNLADFCRRHHTLKHASPWTVKQTGNGNLEWTSPTGRVYTDRVPATVTFVPSHEPDPHEPDPDEPDPDEPDPREPDPDEPPPF